MARRWQPGFEQLVDQHPSMVFPIALRITADRGLAEEVAQDVFVEMDRHLRQLDSPEHALFWLRRVAVSRSTDALRRRRVRRTADWVEISDHHHVTREGSTSPLGTRIEAGGPGAGAVQCVPPLNMAAPGAESPRTGLRPWGGGA
jgi:RNA polymerase sigma-70 factor (ECF subfamily)